MVCWWGGGAILWGGPAAGGLERDATAPLVGAAGGPPRPAGAPLNAPPLAGPPRVIPPLGAAPRGDIPLPLGHRTGLKLSKKTKITCLHSYNYTFHLSRQQTTNQGTLVTQESQDPSALFQPI